MKQDTKTHLGLMVGGDGGEYANKMKQDTKTHLGLTVGGDGGEYANKMKQDAKKINQAATGMFLPDTGYAKKLTN